LGPVNRGGTFSMSAVLDRGLSAIRALFGPSDARTYSQSCGGPRNASDSSDSRTRVLTLFENGTFTLVLEQYDLMFIEETHHLTMNGVWCHEGPPECTTLRFTPQSVACLSTCLDGAIELTPTRERWSITATGDETQQDLDGPVTFDTNHIGIGLGGLERVFQVPAVVLALTGRYVLVEGSVDPGVELLNFREMTRSDALEFKAPEVLLLRPGRGGGQVKALEALDSSDYLTKAAATTS